MPRILLVAAALAALLAPRLAAQPPTPARSLDQLVRQHRQHIDKAFRDGDEKAQKKATDAYLTELRAFLQHEAKGPDRAAARFTLVGALLDAGQRDTAKQELRAFRPDQAGAVECADAAMLAGRLGMTEQRGQWIEAALACKSTFDERMELGERLVTVLQEVRRGEALFAAELKAASTDEARAKVLWFQARATREREDLPEGAYDRALQQLAKALPKTRYGRIAADRLCAMEFKIGGDPLPLELGTLDGGKVSLASLRGKPVLLAWLGSDPRSAAAANALQQLHRRHAAKGLKIVVVSLAENRQTAGADAKAWNADYTTAWVEGGFESDAALRYRVEDVPICMLIGRGGKIAGLNFVLTDRTGQRQVDEAVRRSL